MLSNNFTNWIVYDPTKTDFSSPSGLWFCATINDVFAVGKNAFCLKEYGQWDDLLNCKKFFCQFHYIVVASPIETERNEMAAELSARINSLPILKAKTKAFKRCSTLTQLKEVHGQEAVDLILCGAEELQMQGLLDLSTVVPPNLGAIPRTLSGISVLDTAIGGFYAGELSIWTGKRGEGKSTFLGQLLLQAINQGHPVCAYSGELPAWRFKQWVSQQAAGPNFLDHQVDKETDRKFHTVPKLIQEIIDQWWKGKFFLYDLSLSSAHDENSIMELFEYAARRFGCDTFLVDNLMTTKFSAVRDSDFYRAQSNFTGRLVEFAKRRQVHIHLVAHPRKAEGGRDLEADDVGGSGEVTNRADNVFSVKRLPAEKAEQQGFQSVLSVLKNRANGAKQSIGLNFDNASKRFYKSGAGTPDWRFGWEYYEQEAIEEV